MTSEIKITVEGGVIQDVEVPAGIDVEVHVMDFDDDSWPEHCAVHKNEVGESYALDVYKSCELPDNPITEVINELPLRVRDYIHALEARADPAGEIQELFSLKESVVALTDTVQQYVDPPLKVTEIIIHNCEMIMDVPKGTRLIIKDYDAAEVLDGAVSGDLMTDDAGDDYVKSVWNADDFKEE